MSDDRSDDLREHRQLDVKVARAVLGFRWVRWSEETAAAKAMEFRHGRFLAPADHVAAGQEVDADPTDPLAPEWDRFVPAFTRQIDFALAAADHVGLFRRDVTIRHPHPEGWWTVRTEPADGSEVYAEAEHLPEALCRAVLEALSDDEGPDDR